MYVFLCVCVLQITNIAKVAVQILFKMKSK